MKEWPYEYKYVEYSKRLIEVTTSEVNNIHNPVVAGKKVKVRAIARVDWTICFEHEKSEFTGLWLIFSYYLKLNESSDNEMKTIPSTGNVTK